MNIFFLQCKTEIKLIKLYIIKLTKMTKSLTKSWLYIVFILFYPVFG